LLRNEIKYLEEIEKKICKSGKKELDLNSAFESGNVKRRSEIETCKDRKDKGRENFKF
jgi:hypothetical protein